MEIEFPAEYERAARETGPTREELLKKLRARCNRGRKPQTRETTLATRLADYTKLPESAIKTLMQSTGTKKLAKHPHKFAKKIAEMLPEVAGTGTII